MSLFVGDGPPGEIGRRVLARAADGGVVPEGVPYSNSPLARLWRLPTQFLPLTPALAWGVVAAAVAVVVWLVKKAT